MFFVLSSFFYMSLRIKTKIQSPSTQNQQEKQIVMQKVFQNSFSGNLAQNQVWNMSFSLSQTGTLFVGTWGTLWYKGESFSWILYEKQSVPLSFSWDVFFKWLAWVTPVEMSFSGSEGIEFPYNYYKKIQNFWGNEVEVWRGKISE